MMKPKAAILIVLSLMYSSFFFSQESKTVKSSLESANVFFKGAELTHKASAVLSRGESVLTITDISPNIDLNSLKIKASNGVVITSYAHSVDYLTEKGVSASQKKYQDSITIYENKIRDNEIKLETNKSMIELLNANKSIAGAQTGLSVAELMKMMDYYQAKSNELQKNKRLYEDENEKYEERVDLLEKQIEEEKAKNTKTSGVLKVALTSPVAATSAFTITYYTASASWYPYYDINVAGVGQSIKIASKARVRQTTGIDWKKVQLTLLTSTPSNGKVAPLFNAWFLDFQRPVSTGAGYLDGALSGRVAGLAIAQNSYSPSQDIKIRGFSSSSVAAAPLYILNGQPIDAGVMQGLDPSMIANVEALKDASATSIYGSRGANGVVLITTKEMGDFVSRDDNELNMTYNIDLPYTIEGNGKIQAIDLQTYTLDADFKYYCAPKLDTETYLLAEISDWQKLGLLSGKANVTYEGTYVGETTIDASSTRDKLTLTLGVDKRVAVKREKLQDYSSKKFLANNVKQDFSYKLTIKNNQNRKIKMVLKDQYPISSQKDIEVELMKDNTSPSHQNEEVGVYTWEFELEGGESKIFKMGYSVKYPKNSDINL